MAGWSTSARLVWLGVVGFGSILTAALLLEPEVRALAPPSKWEDWLVLGTLTLVATYLGLRPIQVAPDRRLTAASAPVIALALLFDARTAVLAAASAGLASHVIRRSSWHVALFNVAQRCIAVTLAVWTCAAFQASLDVPFFVPCAVSAAAFFLANTAMVAGISATRKGVAWGRVWVGMVREQFVGEAALLACGILVAVHAHAAPLALPAFIPPLWLAWRVLTGAAEIRRLNETLRESLEQQKAFVANASHELRTPIASLRAQLEMMRGQVGASPREELAHRVDELAQETARIGALLSDLLVLARSDAGLPMARERVSMEDVLFDVYRELRPLSNHVHLRVHLDDDTAVEPVVIGDHERLRQLLLNLGANALRFTPPGGSVEIRSGLSDQWVRIDVRDTGIGIAPDDLPRIFDRFYRADSGRARDGAHGGSGLGLSIAKSIVEAHGGSITVESLIGRGSTFTVLLPLAPSEERAVARSGERAATAVAR